MDMSQLCRFRRLRTWCVQILTRFIDETQYILIRELTFSSYCFHLFSSFTLIYPSVIVRHPTGAWGARRCLFPTNFAYYQSQKIAPLAKRSATHPVHCAEHKPRVGRTLLALGRSPVRHHAGLGWVVLSSPQVRHHAELACLIRT